MLGDLRQFDLGPIICLNPLRVDRIEHLKRVSELLGDPGVVCAVGQPNTGVGVSPRVWSAPMPNTDVLVSVPELLIRGPTTYRPHQIEPKPWLLPCGWVLGLTQHAAPEIFFFLRI